MLEYWKNEAKVNEEMLKKANKVISRNAQLEKFANTLKAIYNKNLMKHLDVISRNNEPICPLIIPEMTDLNIFPK